MGVINEYKAGREALQAARAANSTTLKNALKGSLKVTGGVIAGSAAATVVAGKWVAEKAAYQLGRTGIMRAAGLAGATAAIVAGAAYIAHKVRGSRKAELEAEQAQQQAAMDAQLSAMEQQVMSGPADGRGTNEWRNRVSTGRGQAAGMGPVNPAMNVVPESSVQDLGQAR